MTKNVDSELCVKACAKLDVSDDLKKCSSSCKSIQELLDDQKEKDTNTQTTTD